MISELNLLSLSKEKEKNIIFSNLIFAFGGNLFDHWEYILINW
jgi:hypothetical protein